MAELKPLVCQNCGGRINRGTMKCEYCDTQYESKVNGVELRYVAEKPGTHIIMAKVQISQAAVMRNPDAATKYAMDKMRNQIADGLLNYLKISTEQDMRNMCQIIRGEIRVVDPTFTDYL